MSVTGGELPACILVDAVRAQCAGCAFVRGVLELESYSAGLLGIRSIPARRCSEGARYPTYC